MTDQAPNWYKEIIRDKVRARNKVRGGYLDDTMVRGDGGAGVVKFPVIGGKIEVYELTGAIQQVKISNPTLSMVQVSMRDFEASCWLRVQDARRQGPVEQQAVADEMAKAIRKHRDDMKLQALDAFCNLGSTLPDAPQQILTIGDGTTRIDLLDVIEAKTSLFGSGTEEEVYWPIPEAWMDQLEMYKEFANSEYIGSADLPFARANNVRKRTFRGIHIYTIPDVYFAFGTGRFGSNANALRPFDEAGFLDTFMWAKDAMGAEMEWDEENMSLTSHPLMEGTPMLGKVGLSGNVVGLLPEGVKRLRFRAQNRAVRPA